MFIIIIINRENNRKKRDSYGYRFANVRCKFLVSTPIA